MSLSIQAQKILTILYPNGVPVDKLKEVQLIIEAIESVFSESPGQVTPAQPTASPPPGFTPSPKLTCTFPGCRDPKKAKGFCSKHYQSERNRKMRESLKK